MSKDPRVDRIPGEIQEHYDDQMAMLADRCDAFYEGKHREAKSASAILYTLLYDHGKSAQSLLAQLKLKEGTKFLDSRCHNELTINTAKGAWPRTPTPYAQYREKDLLPFKTWWTEQEFKVLYTEIIFTRKELVEAIRHKEGGGHVAPQTHEKIARLRRTPSPWRRSITENEDGSTQMYVGISLNREPVSEDSDAKVISEYELASVCAIAEEVLFSLTPEPDNRKRMMFEEWKKPFYLSSEESDACKDEIRQDLAWLEGLADLDQSQCGFVTIAKKSLEKALEIECMTSEDILIRRQVPELMKQAKIDYPDAVPD